MIHKKKIIQKERYQVLTIQIHYFQILKLKYIIKICLNQLLIKIIIKKTNKCELNSYNIQIEILSIQITIRNKMKSYNH